MRWRWEAEEGEGFAKGGEVVLEGAGNPEEREILGGEESIDDGVAREPVGGWKRALVERDAADQAAGGGIGDEEVEVMIGDIPESGPAAAFGADFEQISEPDLTGDAGGRVDEGGEDVKKGLVVRRGQGGGSPRRGPRAMPSEQVVQGQREQGRAKE